jgi:3-deoxy-manno-octulosonate cytidylyltransferase (CMP-KDO synthetase)
MQPGVLEMAESLEQLRILENGYKIKLFITLHDSPSVDVPEDMGMVRDIIQNYGGCAG